MPKLKKEYADSRKREIVMAAWESFMEKGYEKTTMREIARRMNATTGVIYNYYKNKRDILLEMQNGIQKNIERGYTNMEKSDSVRDAYAGFFKFEFKYSSESQARKNCRAMVGLLSEAMSSEGLKKLINVSFKNVEERGAKIIKKGIKNGEIHAHANPKATIGFFQALEWGLWMQIALIDGLNINSYLQNIRKILMGNVWRNEEKK